MMRLRLTQRHVQDVLVSHRSLLTHCGEIEGELPAGVPADADVVGR